MVPNPYLPTFRIFTYNITGANSAVGTLSCDERARALKDRVPKHPHGGGGKAGDKKKLCKEKEHKGSWKCKLHEPWHSDDKAPSRMNTLWSPLGYAQVRASFSFLTWHAVHHSIIVRLTKNFIFRSFTKSIISLILLQLTRRTSRNISLSI